MNAHNVGSLAFRKAESDLPESHNPSELPLPKRVFVTFVGKAEERLSAMTLRLPDMDWQLEAEPHYSNYKIHSHPEVKERTT